MINHNNVTSYENILVITQDKQAYMLRNNIENDHMVDDRELSSSKQQLVVEQNVHSVHCTIFYLCTSKKLNEYYFKVPDLHTQSWILPKPPPLQQPSKIITMITQNQNHALRTPTTPTTPTRT